MKQDLEPGVRPDDDEPPKRDGGRALWVASGVALAVVLAMIAIGTAGVFSASDGAPDRAEAPTATVAPVSPTRPAAASTSPEPPAIELADISFVDLSTRRVTALPQRIRSIAEVGHFRASPNGSKLAFDDGGSIYVANLDSSRIRTFTRAGGVSAPSWSPDGKTIVFSDGPSGFLLDVATGTIRRVIRDRREIWAPNFSADGRTILYTAVRGDRLTLRTTPSAGGPSSLVLTGAFGAYSPDGSTIAFRETDFDGEDLTEMTSGRIWLADADGTHPREVGHSCCSQSQIDPEALWPMWSPDGTKVAFQPLYGRSVKVFDVRAGRQALVGDGTDPSWLDEGTLIVSGFAASSVEVPAKHFEDIVYLDLRDGSTRPLPRSLRAIEGARNFQVSPDGARFAFEAIEEGSRFQIFLGDIDGEHVRQLTHIPVGARLGDWSPDGSLIVFATESYFVSTARIATVDVEDGTVRRLTPSGLGFAPSFSPNGRSIQYSHAWAVPTGWRTELVTVPISGGRPSSLLRFAALGAFSPDGSTIAFHRTAVTRGFCGECWRYGLSITFAATDGSDRPTPVPGGVLAAPWTFEPLLPRWSPGGRRVLFGYRWSEARYPGGNPTAIEVRPIPQEPTSIFVPWEPNPFFTVGRGSTATWFDEHTIIVSDFKEV